MVENLLYYGDNLDILRRRLQLLTIEELLAGRQIDCPPPRQANVTFRRTPGSKKPASGETQNHLFPG